jgi:hypothetical protein
MKDKF